MGEQDYRKEGLQEGRKDYRKEGQKEGRKKGGRTEGKKGGTCVNNQVVDKFLDRSFVVLERWQSVLING
jgi:hypothetical protein